MDTLKYAYGYVRVSTDKQEELSPGLRCQKRHCSVGDIP